MIVPEEDEDMQYFDDDLRSFSSSMGDLSGEEEAMEKILRLRESEKDKESAIPIDGFSGFKSLDDIKGDNNVVEATREMAGGDCTGDAVEIEENEPVDRNVDVFGRHIAKGRSNWFASEHGSNFRLMDGELLSQEFSKPERRATSDVEYIKQLYSGDISLSELSVGEDTKRIGWGSFLKGDPDTWNVWNSESELPTLTTLDVQRNVAAAVNSRRKMKWAIGVEKNGMVTGVQMNEEEKDILRQAVDFSLSREFVPELDTRIVKMELVRVSAATGDRYLILITIKSLVESLHQLSSGRIFYLMGDKVVMAESINQIRLALDQRMKHDDRVKEKGEEETGSSFIPIYSAIVVGLTLSFGALYASKRWIK